MTEKSLAVAYTLLENVKETPVSHIGTFLFNISVVEFVVTRFTRRICRISQLLSKAKIFVVEKLWCNCTHAGI